MPCTLSWSCSASCSDSTAQAASTDVVCVFLSLYTVIAQCKKWTFVDYTIVKHTNIQICNHLYLPLKSSSTSVPRGMPLFSINSANFGSGFAWSAIPHRENQGKWTTLVFDSSQPSRDIQSLSWLVKLPIPIIYLPPLPNPVGWLKIIYRCNQECVTF